MQNKHQLEWAKENVKNFDTLPPPLQDMLEPCERLIVMLAQAIIADAEATTDKPPGVHVFSSSDEVIPLKTSKVTRLEVVDSRAGRLLTRYNTSVELDYQDQGKTLKVFLKDT